MSPRQPRPRAAPHALLVCCALLSATGMAGAHEGGLGTQVMWEACAERKVNEPCSFENLDRDVYRGSCQAMSNALVCVRNQPIERASASPHQHEPEPGPAPTSPAGRWWLWLAGCAALLAAGRALSRRKRITAA